MPSDVATEAEVVAALKALANERRLTTLEWLKAPRSHFRARSTAIWSRTGSAAS